jgi:hypothetical protein
VARTAVAAPALAYKMLVLDEHHDAEMMAASRHGR